MTYNVNTLNLIYLGNYGPSASNPLIVDPIENNGTAEDASLLNGLSVDHETLQIVQASTYDNFISDDDFDDDDDDDASDTEDTITYNVGNGSITQETDATLEGEVLVTLQDGSQVTVQAVIIQTTNGDLFITDLNNDGTLDNLAITSVEIVEITEDCLPGWGTHQSVDGSSICAPVVGDGIVEGSSGDDLIDIAYTGDPEGDMIDNEDAINPAHGPNDDLVHAGAGNDTVLAGAGDDTIHGGSGDDSLSGGAGNDVIEGDTNAPGGSTTSRQVFEWDKAPDPNGGDPIDNGDSLSSGFSQDTGEVTVDFSVLH